MSSAYSSVLMRSESEMGIPTSNEFISLAISLTKIAKSIGASVSPWRTPEITENQSVTDPLTLTQASMLLYIVLIILYILP